MIQVEEKDSHFQVRGCGYELLIPRDFGPRVMSLRLGDGPNVFHSMDVADDPLRIRGGHRLWVAPERREVTWSADDEPVEAEQAEDHRLVVRGPREAGTGLIKELSIEIDDGRIGVTHQIYNTNPWTIELSPWALTIMRPGGWAVAPFPPRGEHPVDLAPSNPLVMWPYTDLSDARWKLLPRHITLRQDAAWGPHGGPQKIGSYAEDTWCAYVLDGWVFRKSSQAYPHMDYPDMGCSFELFTNQAMLELETLGPMVSLEPGECVRHEEEWTLERPPAGEIGDASAPGAYFG